MDICNEKIRKFIEKRLNDKNIDVKKFLNPTIHDLRDANKLKNITEAKEKILDAINGHKKIVVFGDYDCDGVSSAAILYLFFRSLGADVDVYIPNRFENGYGISAQAIEEIQAEFSPDLVVTVDLGITAIEEVEILKQEGIDIVITDHHIPLEELPDCVVVDPKLDDGSYGFDALCGAGVALKLVEAIAGREEALKYLDFCAIATVGDIVPLLDENRVIAKFGIEKINSGNCHKSLTFLKNKLELAKITSTDVSFKIVPRINACGRMNSALKAFEFLVEDDELLLEEKYQEIEADNIKRLRAIEDGNKQITKILEDYDLSEPSILVRGEFHEGVIGILASRVCRDTGKPTIIFTKDEMGNYKGSGRSTASFDIHSAIVSLSYLLENFGGHKMACGLELQPELFDEFKEKFNEILVNATTDECEEVEAKLPDIVINEEELSEKFLKELDLLEPFGCENEKPLISFEASGLIVEQMSDKAYQHFKLRTSKNKQLIAFNFYNYTPILKTKSVLEFFVDLSWNYYKSNKYLCIQAKDFKISSPKLSCGENYDFLSALKNKYFSIFDSFSSENYHVVEDLKSVILQKLSESKFGTVIVAQTDEDLRFLEALNIDLNSLLSPKQLENGENIVLVSPAGVNQLQSVSRYNSIIFLHKYFDDEHLYFSQNLQVYEPKNCLPQPKLLKGRDVFASVYKHILNYISIKCNDEIDFSLKLHNKCQEFSSEQILFCVIVFMELNFIELDEQNNCFKLLKAKKMELSSSKFYSEVKDD